MRRLRTDRELQVLVLGSLSRCSLPSVCTGPRFAVARGSVVAFCLPLQPHSPGGGVLCGPIATFQRLREGPTSSSMVLSGRGPGSEPHVLHLPQGPLGLAPRSPLSSGLALALFALQLRALGLAEQKPLQLLRKGFGSRKVRPRHREGAPVASFSAACDFPSCWGPAQ